MKRFVTPLLAVLCLLAAACTSKGPRTVEMPYVAAKNNALDVCEVSLSDSATAMRFNIMYRPGLWIRIDTASHIVADGKEYALKNADGIVPGEKFFMPESGKAEFTLVFEPVPFDTESIDFTEGVSGGWDIWGIDLSGKAAVPAPRFCKDLPKDIINIDTTDVFSDPVMEIAPTELRFHVLNYRPEYGNLKVLISGLADTEEFNVELDKDGNGTISPIVYGTSEVWSALESIEPYGDAILIAPGTDADIYFDAAKLGDYILSNRPGYYNLSIRRTFDNGRYAALNRVAANFNPKIGAYGSPDFDWRLTPDEFTKVLLGKCAALRDSLAAADFPQPAKDYFLAAIDNQALSIMSSAKRIYFNNFYIFENTGEGINDSITALPGPDQYAQVLASVDLSNPKLLAIPAYGKACQADWSSCAAENKQMADVAEYIKAYAKAKSGKLSQADIDRLAATPFYANAVKQRQSEAEKAYEEIKAKLIPVPETDGDIFDAIVAPYKGKVVLVDLWNTWCAPCRAALAANEPLKTGVLSSPDIVWLYIADESSTLSSYAAMIPGIKGNHMLVSQEQIDKIRNRFNVDGIPYYILVDRDGKATGHPDFRDHDKLVEGVKAAL